MSCNKNNNKNLEKKNKELSDIICNAPIPIFAINRKHKITHFNKALEALSGLSRDDMIGTDHQWKAFYSAKRPIMADFIIDKASDAKIMEYYGKKHIESTNPKEGFAATQFFPDLGDTGKWLHFCASAVTNENGDIISAVETLQDITDEKNAQQKTKELYRIYQGLLDFIPYPIVVFEIRKLFSITFTFIVVSCSFNLRLFLY